MGSMKQMACPICRGRAFDISKIPKEQIEVELKCPKCRNLVTVKCIYASERKTRQYAK